MGEAELVEDTIGPVQKQAVRGLCFTQAIQSLNADSENQFKMNINLRGTIEY